jgi:hypothetical protein
LLGAPAEVGENGARVCDAKLLKCDVNVAEVAMCKMDLRITL